MVHYTGCTTLGALHGVHYTGCTTPGALHLVLRLVHYNWCIQLVHCTVPSSRGRAQSYLRGGQWGQLKGWRHL